MRLPPPHPPRRVRAACLALLVLACAALIAVDLQPADPACGARWMDDAARCLARGDAAAAEGHALRALACDPEDARAAFVLGEALAVRGARDEARRAYARAAGIAPRWPAPVIALAADDIARGRVADALDRLDTALARSGPLAPVLRLRAQARRIAGDSAGSIDDLIDAGRLDPGCGRDLLEAGERVLDAARRGNEKPGAARRARRWLEDALRYAADARDPIDGATIRARALLALGEPERALVPLALPPPNPLPPPLCARRILLRVRALDESGRTSDALQILHAPQPADVQSALRDALARAAAPGAHRGSERLAALVAAGPHASVENVLRRETVAAVEAARQLVRRRRATDEAVAVLDARLARPDPHALAWYARGALASRSGDIPAALEHHREALRRDPAFWPAANDLAWLLATECHDPSGALALAEAAAVLRPNDSIVADTLAEVRRRLAASAGPPAGLSAGPPRGRSPQGDPR